MALLGPAFPLPSSLSSTALIQSAVANISQSLHLALSTGHSPYGDLGGDNSSVSITVTSTADDTPLMDFHFSSPSLNSSAGVSHVAADSIYRIGSISKLFTVYALLLNGGWDIWDKSITDYIPELHAAARSYDPDSPISEVDWNAVTIGALASQISGIGRDYANGDLASQPFPWHQFGLPNLPPQDIPTCGGNDTLPPCGRKEYLEGLIKRPPVFAPMTTPVYSNAAFRLLGYVLEVLTGSSYAKAMDDTVLGPLGLSDSSTNTPTGDGRFAVPSGDSGFFQDIGDEDATGGMYSSSRDLSKLGRAILSNRQLSPIDTRRWMKPAAHTARLTFSVGAPWEIYRLRSAISSGRVVDVYTKSGSIGQYNSNLLLLPDYGVTVAILTGGATSGSAVGVAGETVLQGLVPALESTSRRQACLKLCGKYVVQGYETNSSIEVVSDDENPGLVIQSWISNGADIKASAQAYASATGGGIVTALVLHPTNLQETARYSDSSAHSKIAYRLLFETRKPGGSGSGIERVLGGDDLQWGQVDQLMYGGTAVDDFVFGLDAQGTAVAVEPRVLGEVFTKVV